MATEQKKKPKKKLMPNGARRQSLKEALPAIHKQYGDTLARLALK